jgi:hypothetical protein
MIQGDGRGPVNDAWRMTPFYNISFHALFPSFVSLYSRRVKFRARELPKLSFEAIAQMNSHSFAPGSPSNLAVAERQWDGFYRAKSFRFLQAFQIVKAGMQAGIPDDKSVALFLQSSDKFRLKREKTVT